MLIPLQFGTDYFRKRNERSRLAPCEVCGQTSRLDSYDATWCFTYMFCPTLPLGRKRVTDHCQGCGRHRAVPLKEFRRAGEAAVREAVGLYRSAPHDPARALAVIDACVRFDRADHLALDVTPLVERSLSQDPRALAALAGAFVHFGRMRQAEDLYHRALRVTGPAPGGNETREALALLYLRQSRHEDARRCLEHVVNNPGPHHAQLIRLLVEGYQSAGDHEAALALVDQATRAWPGLAADPALGFRRRASEALRGTRRPIVGAESSIVLGLGSRSSAWRTPIKLGVAGMIVLGIVYVTVAVLRGQWRTVYLVNGLDRAYSVTVNGEPVQLPAGSWAKLRVSEGDLSVVPVGAPGQGQAAPSGLSPQTVRVAVPFWSRPFADRTFVVNPDRCALVQEERVTYVSDRARESDRRAAGGDDYQRLHVGEALYEFSGIDYEFEEFPARITFDKNSGSTEVRERVAMASLKTRTAARIVEREKGHDVATQFVRARAAANPADDEALELLPGLLKTQEAFAVLRPHLESRPALTPPHRAYQDLMRGLHPEHDLEGEYREKLAAHPFDGALMFLLARVCEKREEAEKLLRAATKAQPAVADAWLALAELSLSSGEFEAALGQARAASAAAPEVSRYRDAESDALLGLDRRDELLLLNRERQREARANADLAAEEASLLSSAGATQEALGVAAALAAKATPDQVQATQQWRAGVEADVHYAAGDPAAALARLRQPEVTDPALRFRAAVLAEDVEAAVKVLAELENVDPPAHLIVYLEATRLQRTDVAEAQLEAAARAYRSRMTAEGRRVQWWLKEGTDRPEEACSANLQPREKRLFLAAMGVRHPQHRATYFALARRLNFDRTFPHQVVKRATEQK